MKAIHVTEFGGPEVLRMVDIERPEPGPGQVRIKVLATSVNFADIMARQGRYHGAGNPPFIPGLDVTGSIDAIGPDTPGWQLGQRVVAFPASGSYAEYVLADAITTYPIPDAVSVEQAAAFPTVGVTSYELLSKVTQLQPGETVVVHAAAGGIGTTAVQLAKLLGAGLVIGTVSSQEKIEAAKEAGADIVINYVEDHFSDRVLELTHGQGANVILDSVAGPIFGQSLTCLARFGRIAIFGSSSGAPGHVETFDLHGSCRSVIGYSMGTTRRYRPQTLKPSVERVLSYLANGDLKMRVTASYSLDQVTIAQELVESRRSTGKVLLFPSNI